METDTRTLLAVKWEDKATTTGGDGQSLYRSWQTSTWSKMEFQPQLASRSAFSLTAQSLGGAGLNKKAQPFTWTLNKLTAAFFFSPTDIFLYVSSVISERSDSHYTWYTHQDYYLDQRPRAHCSRHVILYNVCHVNCVGLSIQQLTELGSQALLNNHVRSDDNCTTS